MSFYQVLLEQFTRFMSGKLIKKGSVEFICKIYSKGGGKHGGDVTKKKNEFEQFEFDAK